MVYDLSVKSYDSVFAKLLITAEVMQFLSYSDLVSRFCSG